MRILDLGCGSSKRKGAIGADLTRGSAADVIADMNRRYYPFRDGAFDLIVLTHVIEHITDIPDAMEEIWRIATPGAAVEGTTPHFSSASSYADPTHRHHLSIRTFHFLARPSRKKPRMRRLLECFYRIDEIKYGLPVAQKFQVTDLRITLNPLLRKLGVESAVNLYPELYEAFFTFVIPARDILFRLQVIK